MRNGWRRVTKSKPCPICKRPNADHSSTWCMVATDGTAALCPFTDGGKYLGSAGYLHRIGDSHGSSVSQARDVQPVQTIHFDRLASLYQANSKGHVEKVAVDLGVSVDSLRLLEMGWTGEAASFPMRNAAGTIVGIRLRWPDGQKRSVRGGRQGVFVPREMHGTDPVLICEGPTDTAAALTVGFDAIGRPSCLGCEEVIAKLLAGREAVIVTDNDAAGRGGANRLAELIKAPVIPPPDGIKDLRAWRPTYAELMRAIH